MITEKIQFSDTEWLEDLEKGATLAEQLAENLEGLGDVGEENFKQLTEIIGKYEDSLGKVSDKVKTLESDTKRNERVQSNLQKTLKNSIRNTSIFGTTIGDIQDKFGGLTKGMGKSIRSLGTFRGAFSALTKVLIASPLGLILGLVAGIAAALQRNQKFIDRFQQAWAGVNAVFDVLLDRLANVGSVITALFDGGFAAAGKELKNIFAGVGDEIAREITLAQQLTKVLQEVERTEINLNIRRSANNATLKELNKTIEDTTKKTSDRIAAAVEFNKLETGLVNEEVANQERRVAALLGFAEVTDEVRENIARIGQEGVTLDELGISSSTVSDAREFEQEISKLFDLQTRSFEIQTTNQNKLNSLRKEAIEKARQQREEAEKLREEAEKEFLSIEKSIEARIQAFELEKLAGVERLEAEKEIALAELTELEKRAKERAKAAGLEVEVEAQFAELRKLIVQASEEDINKLKAEQSQKAIELLKERQLAELALTEASEEEKAAKTAQIQKESLQKLRDELIAQGLAEDSIEVLRIDVEIAELDTAELDRLRADRLAVISQEQELRNLEIDLQTEFTNDILTIEQNRELARLNVQLEGLKKRREILLETEDVESNAVKILDANIKKVENSIEKYNQISVDPVTLLKNKILTALNINQEQLNTITSAFSSAITQFIDGLNSLTEAQLAQNEQLIASLDERIDELEGQLSEELELRKQGLANNVQAVEAQLKEETEKRREAQQERLELQREAARRQLLVDAATQISSLITASANIISSLSGTGLAAFVLIPLAIATIFSIFAKAKANAAQAAEVPEFGEGGQLKNGLQFGQKMKPGLVKGPSHSKGGVNVVDKKGQLYNIEGEEFMTRASVTKQYHPILEAMNAGEGGFGGISFDEMMAGTYETPGLNIARNPITESKSIREGQDSLQETRIWRHSEDFKSALGEYMPALIESNKNVEHAVRSRPNYIPTKDGYVKEVDTGYGIHRSKYKEL